ncbi:MAG: hypothetical protein AB7N65_23880 [Vicinamibacterales bacterium]
MISSLPPVSVAVSKGVASVDVLTLRDGRRVQGTLVSIWEV